MPTTTSCGTRFCIAAKARPRWKSLKSDLEEAIFVWDTTSVPNGTYVVKVDGVRSSASNTPGAALEGELESSAFDIDNGPPAVVVTSSRPANGRTTIQFEVRDEWSSISKVEYSLDAQRWQVVYPRDGIFDGAYRAVRADAGQRGRGEGAHHPRLRCEKQLGDRARRCHR